MNTLNVRKMNPIYSAIMQGFIRGYELAYGKGVKTWQTKPENIILFQL